MASSGTTTTDHDEIRLALLYLEHSASGEDSTFFNLAAR